MDLYDIMHEHDYQKDMRPSLPGAFKEYKMHSYVATIEGFNHCLEEGSKRQSRDHIVPAM